MGKLVPFQPPPGVFKNGTPYQAKGRWSDCNLVRWKDGQLQPLGGWERVIDPGSSIAGIGRAMITWRDFTGSRWLAIGTSEKLYIFTSLSGSAVNITPLTLIPGNESGEVGLGFGVGVFGGTENIASVENKTDISFASPATINSTSTAFTDAVSVAQATPATTTLSPSGPTPFAVGDEIEVLGSVTANNRTYETTGSHRIVSVSTNSMTIGPSSAATFDDITGAPGGGGSGTYAGTITSLNIANAGSGISAGATKTLSATGGGGSNFAGTYTIDSAGAIDSLTITNAGSGYTTTPTIVISSLPTGLGGTFTASDEGMDMLFTSNSHGMSIGDVFRVSTTGTFPSGDQYGNPNIVLAADTDFYVYGGYNAAGDGSGFTTNTWKVALTLGSTEALYFENAGSGTHSFTATADIASVTAGFTGTITTASAGASVTLARTRRFGNESVATSSLVLEASSWVFDLWGEKLVGLSTADGRIVEWNPTATGSTSIKAAVVSGAPVSNSAILVSKQRHLFALGAGGNNRKVQWSDAENNTTWGATATNQAGSFEIDSSGEIRAGKTVGDRILVWTSTDLHAIDWVGMPYVYGRKKIGDACGAISNRSMITVGDQAFWMSYGGFFQYQGSVQPLKCDVQDFLFKDLNRIQDSKIYASINPEFFEVSWWYASSDSDEILKYVTYNYAEGWWSIGSLCRTAFASGSPGVFPNPIGLADDGSVYEHETAISTGKRTTSQVAITNADVSDLDRKLVTGTDVTDDVGLCFAETVMEIGDGENIANVTQLVTDTAGVGDNGLRFKFKTSYSPDGTESTSSNYDLAADGYTDVREQGRQFTYRVESGFDQYWELGSIRAEMSAGGKR
jgi:hypothetical protein